ncbi:origin recognition complex subunit 4 C-terminus-domain-containing protein [Cercophora scortea]|uniref:Origin recognition complex subunit 4 n=1 Tax=Cercophora scortea TaxID=314031 RepID=A0AAE0IE15_9PEZI|nr:origin recognition complex subunit 4 C-terminus-domain-containing protein [Cercophora scortea]
MSGRKSNTATAGRKRARSPNDIEEDSPAPISVKKQRVKGAAAAADEPSSSTSPLVNGGLSLGRRSSARAHKPAGKSVTSIYDVPDSDSEEKDEIGDAAVSVSHVLPQNGVVSESASSPVIEEELEPEPEPEPQPQPVKRRGRPPKNAQAAAGGQEGASTQTKPPDKALARRKPSVRNAAQPAPPKLDAPSAKATKTRRRRDSAESQEADHEEVPKGILSPSKRDSGRRRKSVAFSGAPHDDEAEITFEDLVPKVKKAGKARGARAQKAQEVLGAPEDDEEEVEEEQVEAASGEQGEEEEEEEDGSDDDDDEVCAICSKPDSKRGNQIVFCDSCDTAVHQKCYGLAVIPKGDWICRDCVQGGAEVNGGALTHEKGSVTVAAEQQRPDIPNFDQHLRLAQRVLLDRCTGRRRIKLRGQQEAYDKTLQLVEQTIVAGEGNSMLVIGGRGCGKTTLIESVVTEMSRLHKNQFHVVRLSGFIHTDDKLALREIWRQLGKEMEVEDEVVSKTNNYADTLASLLALLSHPSELEQTQDGVTSKSVIFVMDEFDLFATHARQTLLYNLFDIAQAKKAPIAVLGLTTRIDVVESLEKRVKSRFSHRYVYLSLPKSPPAYWDICRQGLSVDDEDMVAEGIDAMLEGHSQFWEWWNGELEALHKTRGFLDSLDSHFYSTKSVSAFLTTCILPLAGLRPTAPSLRVVWSSSASAAGGAQQKQVSLEPADSKLHLLESLSDLDLSMLIAAARLDIVAHTDTVNFAMAYDEYTSLMGRQRAQSASSGLLALGGGTRVWGRGIGGIAWERLVALGLLVAAAPGGRGSSGLGGLDAKMWKLDVALEEIAGAVKLNAVLARWCREI